MSSIRRQLLLLAGDACILYASLALALAVRQLGPVPADFLLQHAVRFAAIFPIWLTSFYVLELYELPRIQDLIALIGNTAVALAFNLASSIILFYLFSIQFGMTPKTNLLVTVLLSHVGIFLWRHFLIRVLMPRLAGLKVAFWGESPLFDEMIQDIKTKPYLGYVPVACPRLASRPAALDRYWAGERAAPGLKASVDLIVVDSDRLEADPAAGQSLLSAAIIEGIPIRTQLDFYEEINLQIPPGDAAKSGWILSHVLQRPDRAYLAFKRAIDVALSVAGLLALAPLLALIAAATALVDGGKPLYRQRRVGRHGKEFTIWKFRTMRDQPEQPLSEPTGRVTPLGAWLRRFRLDELPQLWNVLAGDMSLVGPRPEWTSEVRILEKTVPHYHLRHLVKPGITGWAQVHFRATHTPDDSFEKLHYDLFYVKNISLALDIGIILKTIKRVLREETSFAPRHHHTRHAAAGKDAGR